MKEKIKDFLVVLFLGIILIITYPFALIFFRKWVRRKETDLDNVFKS